MIEVLSQMHLLIAVALMAAATMLAAGTALSLYFLYERVAKLARRKHNAERHSEASSEKPKAAHA